MTRFSGTPDPDPQDLLVRAAIKRIMRAAGRSGKDRVQIAQELSTHLGRNVTERMLDDFVAPSKGGSRFPAAWVAAFCEVTGDNTLLGLLVGPELDAALKLVKCARAAVLKERDPVGSRARR
jgi:hypothetical protein